MSRILTMSEALSIQKALNAKGFNLDEDGHLGALTQAALIKFQLSKGIMPADGNPSLATTQALGISPIETPVSKPLPVFTLSTILALLPLLKGSSMTSDQIGGVVRAILTALVAYLAGKGIIPEGAGADLIAAATTILVAIWSIWSNRPKVIVPIAAK